ATPPPGERSQALKSSGLTGGCIPGLVATIVFSMTAALLTIAGYVYGAVLGIAPEFPFMLTGAFMAAAMVIMLGSPLVFRILASSDTYSQMSQRSKGAIGGGAGFAAMIFVWVLIAPGANAFDWPGMLYFLQLALPGAAAGIAFGIMGTVEAEAVVRIVLSLAASFLVILVLPFMPLWLAKRDFESEASREAGRHFQLPADISFTIADEGSASESLQANVRYRATGSIDDGGRSYSVNVLGERRRYTIGVREVYAYIRVPTADYAFAGDWGNLAGNPQAQKVVLDLARSYCKAPLRITSIDAGATPAAQSMKMQGDGLEVTARPAGGRPPSQIDLAFVAQGR
ncbi:MAG: hypothetical protein ACYCW5_02490, partial [Thermoleophilia bacterium]